MSKKSSELRILHLSAARTWRGGEQQLAYLAAELRSAGIRQWICCVEGSMMEAFCKREGFEFFSYRKGFPFNPLAGWLVKKICEKNSVNLLHTHDSHAHTFAMLSVLLGNRTPLVVHRRVDFPIGGNFFSTWKYNHPLVKKIICTSHGIRQVTAPGIRDSSKLAVVHSGIDFARFGLSKNGLPIGEATPKNRLREEFNTLPGQLIIANVAAIAPHKDYFTFVKTAEILLKNGLNAHFFLIGEDGGAEAAIRSFIREKDLEKHFTLTGFRPDVPQLLPGVDLLLFTSKTEGIGGATLEAFACRVPVVATAAGGVPEVVEDGVTGLLAPAGDAAALASCVMRMTGDEILRKRLIANAFEKVKYFTKEKTAAGVRAIYGSLAPTP